MHRGRAHAQCSLGKLPDASLLECKWVNPLTQVLVGNHAAQLTSPWAWPSLNAQTDSRMLLLSTVQLSPDMLRVRTSDIVLAAGMTMSVHPALVV
jgi:hypothetical protein